MRITIAAAGRLRAGPERELFEHYRKRLSWPVEAKEIVVRGSGPPDKITAQENDALLAAIPDGAAVLALDATGAPLSSEELAAAIGGWRDGGRGSLAVVIGGADGLAQDVRDRADLVLSLGRVTWPHLLVRGLILEQLYRAQQILAGHPYHRG